MVLLPGCLGKVCQTERGLTVEVTLTDGTTLLLASDGQQDFTEWRELLTIAISKLRSKVYIRGQEILGRYQSANRMSGDKKKFRIFKDFFQFCWKRFPKTKL